MAGSMRGERAVLVLEDGTTWEGTAVGATGESIGEVCFNTGIAGYQELLTDPSCAGQIIAMTYTLIGNYGVTPEDSESGRVHAGGLVVSELARLHSSWRATGSLADTLAENGTVGLEGIDTRALTRHIREHGSMAGALSSVDLDAESLMEKIGRERGRHGRDPVREVTVPEPYEVPAADTDAADRLRVVAYDFGMRRSLAGVLAGFGCEVTVVPAMTAAQEVLALEPDGVFLSNGPGDPNSVTYAIEAIRKLLGKKPIFGVCLGHQLLGLAMGAGTRKLKFGHRGANQPVMSADTGRVENTTQNHGWVLDAGTLERCGPGEVELTHWNLNDMTAEGIRCEEAGAFSVQYYPSPEANGSRYLYEQFVQLMKERR